MLRSMSNTMWNTMCSAIWNTPWNTARTTTRSPSRNTAMLAILLFLGMVALAQNADPGLGVANAAIPPLDLSLGARAGALQQPLRVSSSSISLNAKGHSTSGEPSGREPEQTMRSGLLSATASVWGPQGAAPARLSISNWSSSNSQAAACKAPGSGPTRISGGNIRGAAGPGNSGGGGGDLSLAEQCFANASLGRSAMPGSGLDLKAESQSAVPATPASDRLPSLRLQMANASANGILHDQSRFLDAAEPQLPGSPADRLKASALQDWRSRSSSPAKRSLLAAAAVAVSSGSLRAQRLRSLRRGGHHPRIRHHPRKQESSGDCQQSGPETTLDNSSGEPCQPAPADRNKSFK
jgi:hypothetical protein